MIIMSLFDRGLAYILLIGLVLSQVTACGVKKGNTLATLNDKIPDNPSVRLDFNILPKAVSFEGMKVMEYINSELLTTVRHTNLTNYSLRLYHHNFIIFENYEIKNINGERKDNLLHGYDYSIVFDPDDPYYASIMLEPKGFIMDTLNIIRDFRFDLAEPDTFLIRIKKYQDENFIYSNWDTLIVR